MRRRPGTTWAAILLALAVAACSSPSTTTPGPISTSSIDASASGTPAASPEATARGDATITSAAPTSPVEGVLLHIDSKGLADVEGFTLRLGDGSVLELRIGTLENGDEFPLGHLAEHLATSSPVRVFFRPAGSDLEVYRIEDAG